MRLICIIDDSAIHRRVATHVLSNCSGIVVPDSPERVKWIDPDNVGLLILDRHLASDWRAAAESLVERIGNGVEIIEWTAGTRFDTRDRWPMAVMTLEKTGAARELAQAVNRWIKFGTTSKTVEV